MSTKQAKCPAASLPEKSIKHGNVVLLSDGSSYPGLDESNDSQSQAEEQHAMLLFKMPELRAIGDGFGDMLRCALSKLAEARLHKCLRPKDRVQFISEDEVAIQLYKPLSTNHIVMITQRLMAEATGSYTLDDTRFRLQAVIGIYTSSERWTDAEQAIRFARIAARNAESRKDSPGYYFFSQDLLTIQCEKVRMSVEIDAALANDRMQLHYQPQYNLDSGEIIAVEALIRLQSENGELIAPDRFIPVAEDSGQIIALGHWVIREACSQLRHWREAGLGMLQMSVNVSPRQLTDSDLLDVIDEAITNNGLDYADLVLELTEQCIVEQLAEVQALLEQLHDRGVRIAIDDFGTGFSCFSYLSSLPVDVIKMDRSFLQAVPAEERANRTLSAMIAMAEKLEMEMIVEGVETEDQHAFLRETGCNMGQGFGLARPQSAAMLTPQLCA